MAMFNSYVKLPEGKQYGCCFLNWGIPKSPWVSLLNGLMTWMIWVTPPCKEAKCGMKPANIYKYVFFPSWPIAALCRGQCRCP